MVANITLGRRRAIERRIQQGIATPQERNLLIAAQQQPRFLPGQLITPGQITIPQGRAAIITLAKQRALERQIKQRRASPREVSLFQAAQLGERQRILSEAKGFYHVGGRRFSTKEFSLKDFEDGKVLQSASQDFFTRVKRKGKRKETFGQQTFIPTQIFFGPQGIIQKEIKTGVFKSEIKKYKGLRTELFQPYQKTLITFQGGRPSTFIERDVTRTYVKRKPDYSKTEQGTFISTQFDFLKGIGKVFTPKRPDKDIRREGRVNIDSRFGLGKYLAMKDLESKGGTFNLKSVLRF